MASVKGKYWSEFYNILTNYNDQDDTPLSNVNIKEAINQVIPEERVVAEADNVTFDMFVGVA